METNPETEQEAKTVQGGPPIDLKNAFLHKLIHEDQQGLQIHQYLDNWLIT